MPGTGKHDDVTALVDLDPSTSVAPFWEVVDNQEATSLQTPREVRDAVSAAHNPSPHPPRFIMQLIPDSSCS